MENRVLAKADPHSKTITTSNFVFIKSLASGRL
jgi:hypothetical protein